MDESNDAQAVLDPNLTPEQLRDIAIKHPGLWPQVLHHPSCYPDLARWIQQESAIANSGASPVNGPVASPSPGQLAQPLSTVATAPPDRKSRSPFILITTILGVVAGLIALAFGSWFLLLRGSEGSLEPTALAQMPQSARVMDISTIGEDATLIPLGSSGSPYIYSGDLLLVGVRGTITSAVVAVDIDGTTQMPQWVLPVPEQTLLAGCHIGDDILVCGTEEDKQEFDMSKGAPIPLSPSASWTPPSSAEDSEEPDEKNEGVGDEGDSEGALTEIDTNTEDGGSADAEDSEADLDGSDNATVDDSNDSDGAQSGPEESDRQTTTVPLTDTATDNAPLAIEGGNLVNAQGKVIVEGVPTGEYWAARAGESSVWVVSNGQLLITINGSQELWRTELPEGSAELNGFGEGTTPHWVVQGSTILVATPEGIIALDITTGEKQWQVDIPVTSWESTDQILLVTHNNVLTVMPYPEEGEPQIQQSGDAPLILGEQQEAVDMPALEEFANAQLEVSEACIAASTLGIAESPVPYANPVQFVDGMGTVTEGGGAKQIALTSAVLEGEPVVAVVLHCGYYDLFHSELVIYDADLNLRSVTFYDDHEFLWGGDQYATAVDGIRAEGSQIIISFPWPLPGEATFTWNGQEYVMTDAVIQTDWGTARPPNLEQMRWIYEQIANQNDAAVEQYFSDDFLAYYQAEHSGPMAFDRNSWFPVGGDIAGCVVIAPENLPPQMRWIGDPPRMLPGMFGWGYAHGDSTTRQPGDFACAITWPNMGASEEYPLWWLVRTDENGQPYIYGSGQSFG